MVIVIKGNVKFTITLDPSVWIFDDRKVDVHTYFTSNREVTQRKETDDIQKISAYWDREIQEGAVSPPTLQTEKQFEKEKILTGTFGMKFAPFLRNAEPNDDATRVVIVTEHGDTTVSLAEAYELLLCFSKDGKPLKEDGPVHIYFGDGSNRSNPITHVRAFIVE
ncbi:peptidyl-prolyl cis-trans isomerase [Anoxybacillus sp.]|uniref:peptidyl-prolyl cis-trans isomerase n=1 Tax=Anoxybacillus sp. TaxID=1872573 RepID=UPI0026068A83|nr:peptidyl-prolyl cis-trans isomerase [uncultured Anoxybacillus sp.]